MTQSGVAHNIEPEGDSIIYIDFENLPEDDNLVPPPDTPQRERWMFDAMDDVAKGTGIIVDDIHGWGMPNGGENELWDLIERRVLREGFDTYSSDSRFEVFPPNTPCDCDHDTTPGLRTYSLAEIRDGTGWAPDARFQLVQ